MLTALVDNPHRVGGRLQRELAEEVDDAEQAVIVLRIDHRSRIYHSH